MKTEIKVTIDGEEHSYDEATHMVEVRAGVKSIRTAQRQTGWLVGNIKQWGQGCYTATRATVLRPLYPREIKERAAQAARKAAKDAELAAEFDALPHFAQRAIREAICLRKGKVRVPAALYTEATGNEYTGGSPYGPRLGRFLGALGVADPVGVIKRHVRGLKPW